jgi:hypothetical protein
MVGQVGLEYFVASLGIFNFFGFKDCCERKIKLGAERLDYPSFVVTYWF